MFLYLRDRDLQTICLLSPLNLMSQRACSSRVCRLVSRFWADSCGSHKSSCPALLWRRRSRGLWTSWSASEGFWVRKLRAPHMLYTDDECIIIAYIDFCDSNCYFNGGQYHWKCRCLPYSRCYTECH